MPVKKSFRIWTKCVEILLINILTDLVALTADGRSNPDNQILGVRIIFFLHQAHPFSSNLLERPLPAGMYQADNALRWIVIHQWNTIGKTHEECHLRIIRKNAVCRLVLLVLRAGLIGSEHRFPMHLPDVKAALERTAKALKKPLVISQHVLWSIANRTA